MLNPQCLLCLVARNLQLESSHRCGGEEGGRSQRYPPTSRTSELRSDSLHRLEPRTQPLEERLFFRICSFTTPLWMRSGKSGEELKQQLPCVTSLKAWKDQFLVHIIALFLPFISWWRDIPHKYFLSGIVNGKMDGLIPIFMFRLVEGLLVSTKDWTQRRQMTPSQLEKANC